MDIQGHPVVGKVRCHLSGGLAELGQDMCGSLQLEPQSWPLSSMTLMTELSHGSAHGEGEGRRQRQEEVETVVSPGLSLSLQSGVLIDD